MTILRMLQLFTKHMKEFVTVNFSFSNKSTLENIKDTDVYAWGKAAKHVGDETAHISENEREALDNVVNAGYATQTELNVLQTEVTETKKSVSDGKQKLATSITEKGSNVASTASFTEMASAIDKIFQGHDTSSVTAGANDVIVGKNIVNSNGKTVAGLIPDRSHVGGNAPGVVSLNASQYSSVAVSIGDVVHWQVNGDGVTRMCIRPPWGIYGGSSGTRGGDGYVGIPVTLLGNAAPSHVLSGVSFTSQNGYNVNGSMVNNGAVSKSLGINGSYTIPAGYHNGSGKVTQNIATKAATTITPGVTSQSISAGYYLTGAQTIKGDVNLLPRNIRSGFSIFGVTGGFNQFEVNGGAEVKSMAPAFTYCFASGPAKQSNGSYGSMSSTWWETTGSKWTQPTNFATYKITTAYTGSSSAYSIAYLYIFNKNGHNSSSYDTLPGYSSYYFLFTIIEKLSETSYVRSCYFVKGNGIDITYYSRKNNGMSFRIVGLESGFILRIYGKSVGSAPSSDHVNLGFEIFY